MTKRAKGADERGLPPVHVPAVTASVTKHRKLWVGRVRLPDGTRPAVRLGERSSMSEARAREVLAAMLERGLVARLLAASQKPPEAPVVTISDVVPKWLPLVASLDVAPATKAQHTGAAKRIAERFGRMRPSEVDDATLRGWLRELSAGLSASRTRNLFFSLSRMLDDATAEGWIALPANPCRSRKVLEVLPALQAPDADEVAHLDEPQVRALLASPLPPERRIRYVLAFATGLRDGELAGLRWSDVVDVDGVPCLFVRSAVAMQGDEGHATRRATKTRSSRRKVPLSPFALAALERWRADGWRAYVGRAPDDDAPILPSAAGRPARPRSAVLFRADLEAAGLPTTYGANQEPIDFHATRRTFATLLYRRGVDGEVIDRLLGHSARSVRERHYTANDLARLVDATGRLELGAMDSRDGLRTLDGGNLRDPNTAKSQQRPRQESNLRPTV